MGIEQTFFNKTVSFSEEARRAYGNYISSHNCSDQSCKAEKHSRQMDYIFYLGKVKAAVDCLSSSMKLMGFHVNEEQIYGSLLSQIEGAHQTNFSKYLTDLLRC